MRRPTLEYIPVRSPELGHGGSVTVQSCRGPTEIEREELSDKLRLTLAANSDSTALS